MCILLGALIRLHWHVNRRRREQDDGQCRCERRSNGELERGMQSVQGQFRTLRLCLQSRYGTRIAVDNPMMPWFMHHAALLIDICRIGEDGRPLYERRKGKRFLKPLPEIGECILSQTTISRQRQARHSMGELCLRRCERRIWRTLRDEGRRSNQGQEFSEKI